MNRHLKTLELDKILNMLASEASFEESKELALSLRPQNNLQQVLANLKETEDAYILSGRFGAPSFGSIKNISGCLARAAAGGMLSMSELLRVAEVLRIVRGVRQWREKCASVQSVLDNRFQALIPNKYLEDEITGAIISDDEMSDKASPALSEIRRKIKNASQKARDVLNKIVHSATYKKYLQDAIVTMRDGRYVVPVKAECRGSISGLVHDTSASGSTIFVEPMGVVEANNDIKVLQSKEEAEIEKILFELSASVGSFARQISDNYEYLTQLDLIFAKASLAYKMKASIPLMNDDGIIELKKARHPLIDKNKVVPVDVRLGSDFSTLVITGPNTGGKTVTLKTIGLLTLMAMCGMMIPASDNSRISVFDNVLADIGDEQSIEQSLSTFSAHMTNISSILKIANNKSLALIDELGAGTDPVEGAALATAILERLSLLGTITAATTHYAELKAYALNTAGVENACCEFDVATLRPTYKLSIGVPGRSNAFAISQKLGIDEDIISRSKKLVSREDRKFESVVRNLEKKRQALEEQLKEAQEKTLSAKKSLEEAEEKVQRVKQQNEAEIQRAKEEAARIVAKTRAAALDVMDSVEKVQKEQKLSAEDKARLRQEIRNIENTADPVEKVKPGDYKLPRKLKVGDSVLLFDIDKKATVLEINPDGKTVLVQAGIIKTRASISNLRLIDAPKPQKPKSHGGTRTVTKQTDIKAVTEVDLRGMTATEAIMDLESAIDSAVLSGINQITIIHGKGTGVLRREVQSFLKTCKAVKTFRLGVFGEGESGVTIATLK
ncbi:endonuclease MutS2 [Ruminococcus sp. zg-924]|uniref:endonuclease MutS2 n=1 Tax=Ruminococcus sp. zg-924 TaxID=2678505 RepID=UPI002108DDD5|nr:endonuclease MutS2 [Ruminococcus sp. zg-924]MCQ4022317.1 endonuclease MutS2 [Ruminococcus sp. zg-924]